RLADRIALVADPARLRILLLLADGERHVGAIRAEVGGSLSYLSVNLALLRGAGLVEGRRAGHRISYAPTAAGHALPPALAPLLPGRARARHERCEVSADVSPGLDQDATGAAGGPSIVSRTGAATSHARGASRRRDSARRWRNRFGVRVTANSGVRFGIAAVR